LWQNGRVYANAEISLQYLCISPQPHHTGQGFTHSSLPPLLAKDGRSVSTWKIQKRASAFADA
jgi:hypothetical protein